MKIETVTTKTYSLLNLSERELMIIQAGLSVVGTDPNRATMSFPEYRGEALRLNASINESLDEEEEHRG